MSLMFNWGYETYSMYSWINNSMSFEDYPEQVSLMGLYWAYTGYKSYDACSGERDSYGSPTVHASADDDDEHHSIDWEQVIVNWFKVGEDLYEQEGYYDKEKYFSYGTNLTDAISKTIIGFNYLCDHCLF